MLFAVLALVLVPACDDEKFRPLTTTEAEQLQTVASRALQLELDFENLRPLASALGERSYSEKHLDDVHGHLEQVSEWLAVANESGDYDWLGPASAMVHCAGLEYDLVRIDLEASARGFGGTVHDATRRGVEAGRAAMDRIHADPGWVARSPSEVADALSTMVLSRHAVSTAPITNTLKSGVTAASVYTGTFSLARLATSGSLGRLLGWAKGVGQPAALVATTEGGVAIRAVAKSGSIGITVAEVQALVDAGIVSATAYSLYAMARGSWHHILTDKNYVSSRAGGPWSPVFEDYLENAGLKFSHPANRVWLEGHKGPHPAEYHREVFRRLREATRGLRGGTPGYRDAVLQVLKEIGKEIQTKGSKLNLLLTGKR